MKKLLSLILLGIVLFVIGCNEDYTPREPKIWDINITWNNSEEGKLWTVAAEGKITKLGIKRNDYCNQGNVCSADCLNHGNYRYVIFNNDDEQTVSFKHLRDPGLIKEGQIGRLYRYKRKTNYKYAWYQWIEVSSTTSQAMKRHLFAQGLTEKLASKLHIEPSIEHMTPPVVVPIVEPIIEEAIWREYDDITELESHDPVLIKLKDDVIAIGFLTRDRQWKLNININKYQQGPTIDNIAKWKRVDLE